MSNPAQVIFYLMDQKATYDPDDASIVDSGTAAEMCKAANAWGNGYVVVDKDSVVQWDFHTRRGWRVPKTVKVQA